MPQSYTYPGVYVEEVSSGVRTIAGVSTSDTAFVDFFQKGPVDDPVRITSFGDFERIFGGLDSRSAASYAIQQYYLNGGSIAYVVRVAQRDGNGVSVAATATLTPTGGALQFRASSAGAWANSRIRLSLPSGAPSGQFNLMVEWMADTSDSAAVLATESFLSLSMDPANARYAPTFLAANSAYVRISHTTPTTITPPTAIPNANDSRMVGGTDGHEPSSNDWRNTTGGPALLGSPGAKSGIYALEKIAPFVFNMLCVPAAAELKIADMESVYDAVLSFAEQKRAFVLIDIRPGVTLAQAATYLGTHTLSSRNGAIYYPRVLIPDPLAANALREMGPSGTIAGIFARTDAQRGIWKAPAGTDATMRNATVAAKLNDLENGSLNQVGVNVLRSFPIYGDVVWGARTIDGADQKASEWKYVPVRRLALYLEESLYQGLKWVVFEPNDEPLWAQIRLNVGAFMNSLFRQGAFQGKSSREAYFVKCDRETTTQNDIDRGIVNIVVGFAPLKPAEFVVLKIQQIAGQLQV